MIKKIVFMIAMSIMFLSQFAFSQAGAPQGSTAVLSWKAPTQRENGQALPIAEIGGYEISYNKKGADASLQKRVVIEDAKVLSYEIALVDDAEYEFKISCYDVNGLSSRAIPIFHKAKISPPVPVDLKIQQKITSPASNCTVDVNCKLMTF